MRAKLQGLSDSRNVVVDIELCEGKATQGFHMWCVDHTPKSWPVCSGLAQAVALPSAACSSDVIFPVSMPLSHIGNATSALLSELPSIFKQSAPAEEDGAPSLLVPAEAAATVGDCTTADLRLQPRGWRCAALGCNLEFDYASGLNGSLAELSQLSSACRCNAFEHEQQEE
eukprot:CAMPEP_0172918156 /NCGR_PEP_ID=MMETSP1075-20121228/199611_1 /TAXON_ID=2916 /ORGANISM="Ceratium fusus, Strain PA161109" /LENGTH=170 /DNA_ID=CAMNT_0013777753 /DNA_START=347 /DNA_END=861 /DNA_ORIENTATION=-